MEDSEKYIELQPSYWIYNAGLVGIARTLQRFEKKEAVDYFFKDGGLFILKQEWEELKKYYIRYMEEIFGKSWFYGKIARFKEGGIFPNNKIINGLKLIDFKFLDKIDKKDEWLYKRKDFQIGKWRLIQWVTFYLSRVEKSEVCQETAADEGELKIIIEDYMKTFKKNKVDPLNIESSLYKWNDEVSKNFLKDVCKYFSLIYFEKWPSLWDESGKLKKEFLNAVNDSLLDQLNSILEKKAFKNKKEEISCSFCGKITTTEEFFETKWFSYEGGSKVFSNFYHNGVSQFPICADCQLIIYFSPLGIFPDGNIEQGEFINIPDAGHLWTLNNYRVQIHNSRKKEEETHYHRRSKLIDSLVSTGAYLQLKSKWLLHNVEIIELGGKRQDTVYSLEISPKALKLLGNYSSKAIPDWLNRVEDIRLIQYENPGDLNKKRYNILTRKYRDFTNGRQLIGYFLDSDTGRLTKAALMLFKIYFEEVERNGKKIPLNEFDRLITSGLKPLLMVILSLMKGKEAYPVFYDVGQGIGYFFCRGEKRKKTTFKDNYLPGLFNCIYTGRKTGFVESLVRIYSVYESEVDDRLLKMLRLEKNEFQVEALLLLVGALGKIEHGVYDE